MKTVKVNAKTFAQVERYLEQKRRAWDDVEYEVWVEGKLAYRVRVGTPTKEFKRGKATRDLSEGSDRREAAG